MMNMPTYEECQERFIKFGECEHLYKEWITPYKCFVSILTCKICKKEHERKQID